MRAFEKAGPFVEQDPQLLADYADLLASKTGGSLDGRPEQLIAKALKLDPDHMQSLWLAGTAAFNRQDYAKAVEHWQRAQRQLPPDSEDAQMLANIIAEATQKKGGRKRHGRRARHRRQRPHRTGAAPQGAGGAERYGVHRRPRRATAPMPLAADARPRRRPADGFPSRRQRRADADPAHLIGQVGSASKRASPRAATPSRRPGDLAGSVGPVKPGAKALRLDHR